MRRFLKGLFIKPDLLDDEEHNERNKTKLRNKNLLECITCDKKTKDILDDVNYCLEQEADVNTTDEMGTTPLHQAAYCGQYVIVNLLLNKNADVNAKDIYGWTPLHEAISRGETNIVRLLLSKNADMNMAVKSGDRPLHMAIWIENDEIVKLLLNKNVNVDARGKSGWTPLHVAVLKGKTNIVKLLLSKQADVNAIDVDGNKPFHLAAWKKQNNIIKLLLKENIDINTIDTCGRTLLHQAVILENTNIVQLLLNKNADANITDKNGNTPLHEAAYKGQKDIVNLLINKNVNVDARGQFGRTPMHCAVCKGIINIVTLLLSKNADVNAKDEDGDTPLHTALCCGNRNIVKLLLDKNANVNAKGKLEKTPLHLAVEYKMTDIVTLLLSKHADVNVTDKYGTTPLHLAARYKQEDIVKLLLGITKVDMQDTFGNPELHIAVNVNAKDLTGNTPLHEAARIVSTDIAALLVRCGADVTLKNNIGDTPLFLCQLFSFEDNAEIVRLLQIAEIEAQKNSNAVHSNNPDTSSCNNSFKIQKKINLKTVDDFGFSGQLYETKMISLFYLRMLNSELLDQDLLLGVNINDIGDMDDICLRYRVRDQQRPVVLFIQGKHKKSPKSRLTNNDLWNDRGGFDLKKYFKSYLKVIERFQLKNEDPMFQGNFEDIDCYFILYTPAQENLGIKKKTKNKVNKILHELINTSESTEPFQYSYDDADINHLMKAVDVNDSATNLMSKYYTTHAKTFLSILWIYSNQAQETTVESIVKKEINKYYSVIGEANNFILEQYSDAMFLIIHHNIQGWWRLKNKAPYLTRSNDLFKLAKLIFLADVLLLFCNAVNFLTNDIRIQFRNFLHFTTGTIEDLHMILCKLLKAINTLKFDNNDVHFSTFGLDFLIADKIFKHNSTIQDSDISDYVSNIFNPSTALTLNNDLEKYNEFKYEKRHGTSEVGGVLLKMKMSSLIFLRALNHARINHNTVLLRAKIPGISMTDICLQFQIKDEQRLVMLFMQLIYRESPEKRKSIVETLWNDSENCSVLKYFLSYLEIKDRFRKSNEDHMFKVGYKNADCNFFLCTPVEDRLTQIENKQYVRREIMDLINTGDNTKDFQLNYDDASVDALVKMTTKDQIKKLGSIFLKSVFPEKYSAHLLSNTFIGKYHVVMAQEVLKPCEEQPINQYRVWKFRSEFFDSNLEHLITLKESFFEALPSKCHSHSRNVLQSLNMKLPLAFGNLDMTFRNNENQTDRIKLVADTLMHLLKSSKVSKIVEINDDDVGPDKMLQQGFTDVNGGIGSAVGNLLIFDTDTKTLKFDLNKKSLPHNTNLFLKELKDNKYYPYNKDLSVYRIKINLDNFPKSSFYDDESDKRQVSDFLRKFWIYPIRAKEDDIEIIFKNEINKLISENKSYYSNGNVSDLISLLCFNEMQKWSLLPNESPYLTRASELFERAELAYIYSLLQSVVNFMYISGTQSIDIKVDHTSDEYEQYEKTKQLFEKIASKLLSILDPQQSDQSIKLYYPRSLQYKMSKLTLKVHPKMDSVLLIFTAEFADNIKHRAFARAGFVNQGSGGKISRAKSKFMIYDQDFINSKLYDFHKLF